MAKERVVVGTRGGPGFVTNLYGGTSNPVWDFLGPFAEGDYIKRVEVVYTVGSSKQVWLGGRFVGAVSADGEARGGGRHLIQRSVVFMADGEGRSMPCFHVTDCGAGGHRVSFAVGLTVAVGAQYLVVGQSEFPEDEFLLCSVWSAFVSRVRLGF